MAGANPARYRGWAGSLGLGTSLGPRPSPRGCRRHRGAGTTLPPASQSPTLPPANRLQQPLPRGCLAQPGELPAAGNCSAKTLGCLVVKQEGGCSRCRNGEAAAVAAWNQRQLARLRHPVPTFPVFCFFFFNFLPCPALLPSCSIPCPHPKLLGVCPSVLCSVLCPARCSMAQVCHTQMSPARHRAWAMLFGHRHGMCSHPGLAKLHPCILPSSFLCSDSSPPAENAQSPQEGTDAQPLAWRPQKGSIGGPFWVNVPSFPPFPSLHHCHQTPQFCSIV